MPILCVSMTNFHAGGDFGKEAATLVSLPPVLSICCRGASSQSVEELYPDTELERSIQ